MNTDFIIAQGETFVRVVRWESLPFVYKAVSAISQSAPMQITAAGHQLPPSWRATLQSIEGMEEANAANVPQRASDFHKATYIDANTVAFNDVDSSQYTPYQSGGYIKYYTPVALAGFTSRMTIRTKFGGTQILALVSPTNIVIDDVNKTITVTITATETAAITKGTYVYDLEMVSGTGVVTKLLYGEIEVTPEVTT